MSLPSISQQVLFATAIFLSKPTWCNNVAVSYHDNHDDDDDGDLLFVLQRNH